MNAFFEVINGWWITATIFAVMVLIIWGPTAVYLHKLKKMFFKGDYAGTIKYGMEKSAFSNFQKEYISIWVIHSAFLVDDFVLAFSLIEKITMKQLSRQKVVLYMDSLLMTDDFPKAKAIFNEISERNDKFSEIIKNAYQPYFDFVTSGKPLEGKFLHKFISPILEKVYGKIRKES